MRHQVSRRTLLRLSVVGAGAAMLGGLGCGSDSEGACNDSAGLTDAQRQQRTSLQYVSTSTHADKKCSNCALFTAGQTPDVCGSCSLLPNGPISPEGHCTGWTARPAT